uniref:Uncharacterized protein n=1 Tax=Romanomermis culicivorax TaxID=13658 RepID=A0A915K027_ROMCU
MGPISRESIRKEPTAVWRESVIQLSVVMILEKNVNYWPLLVSSNHRTEPFTTII